MIVNQDQIEDQREVENCRGKNSLKYISNTTLDLAVFDIKGSKIMMTWQRADERSKQITQTYGGKNDENDMSPTRHECRQVLCSRVTYCQHN